MCCGGTGGAGRNCHCFSDSRPNCLSAVLSLLLTAAVFLLNTSQTRGKKVFHVVSGPIQEVLPVPDQDLVPVPGSTLDLVGQNQGE